MQRKRKASRMTERDENQMTGTPTGFIGVDKALRGLCGGDLIILAA